MIYSTSQTEGEIWRLLHSLTQLFHGEDGQRMTITSESRIRVFAIGIKPTIETPDPTPNDPNHKKSWNIVTTFASFDPQGYMFPFLPESTVSPLPGFVLCGGGAAIRPPDGSLLYDLEPELLAALYLLSIGITTDWRVVNFSPFRLFDVSILILLPCL